MALIIALRRWPSWLTSFSCARTAVTFDAYFFIYEAFPGTVVQTERLAICEIGIFDNELGFCV